MDTVNLDSICSGFNQKTDQHTNKIKIIGAITL